MTATKTAAPHKAPPAPKGAKGAKGAIARPRSRLHA